MSDKEELDLNLQFNSEEKILKEIQLNIFAPEDIDISFDNFPYSYIWFLFVFIFIINNLII